MKIKMIMALTVLLVFAGCNQSQFQWDSDIHVVSREDGSGTRGAFTELTHITEKNEAGESYDRTTVEAIITNSTSVVMTAVAGDPHAVGYLSLGSLNSSVDAVKVDGIEPTSAEIKAGNYPISRPFLIGTYGETTPATEDFIRFILSEDGQKIVEEQGYVSVSDAPAYESARLTGKVVVGGSSSVTPVMEKLKEGYLKLNPNIVLEVQQSDSTTGVASVLSGVYDIGMSSRGLKESEVKQGIHTETIAMDGIVVIVNKENPIVDMKLDDVKRIFTGELTRWNQLKEGNYEEKPV